MTPQKMLVRIWFPALAVLAMALSLGGQSPHSGSGPAQQNVWLKMDSSAKYGYILGFSNATEYYQMILRATCFQIPSLPQACSKQTQQNIRDVLESHPIYAGRTLGQWKAAMDDFYKDSRNQKIDPVSAMQIVGMQLAGYPESQIEKELKEARNPSGPPRDGLPHQ